MDRRKFLGSTSGLVGAGLALGAVAGNGKGIREISSNYDVIVVGAGFAGITAARDCEKNGLKTLILEAGSRLGGRTYSTQFDGMDVEAGGTWIYNSQPFVWSEVQRYGLPIKETPGAVPDAMFLLTKGKREAMGEPELIEAVTGWMTYTQEVRSIIPRAYDLLHNRSAALAADGISAEAHLLSLGLTPLQEAFCRGMVELICNGTADAVSYLDVLRLYMAGGSEFANFMDSAARFKLQDGTISLAQKIHDDGGADISFSSRVESIVDEDDRVRISTSDGRTLQAKAVVSTLPLNTIGNIQFTPPLPDGIIKAAKERHPGRGIKVFLKVAGDAGKVATVAPGRPLNYLMTYEQYPDHSLLVAFSSEPEKIDFKDRQALAAELEVHLPGTALLDAFCHDWNADPLAQGTWATYRPNWARDYLEEFQATRGRIHFASGDHGEGWRGTIDAAIGAGVRAAAGVKKQLG